MDKLLENWSFSRILRLVAGIGLGIYGAISKDYLFLFFGGLFLFQAVLNLSCCGAIGCNTNTDKAKKNIYKDQIEKYNPK